MKIWLYNLRQRICGLVGHRWEAASVDSFTWYLAEVLETSETCTRCGRWQGTLSPIE